MPAFSRGEPRAFADAILAANRVCACRYEQERAKPPRSAPLLHRGAGLPQEAALAAALENVDHPGEMSGLKRRAGPVRRPVAHNPIVR